MVCCEYGPGSLLRRITYLWYQFHQYFTTFYTKVFFEAFICLQFGFLIFWQKDFSTKAAHKMLVKLAPGANVIKLFLSVIYEFS
jgi:hypothetical protein